MARHARTELEKAAGPLLLQSISKAPDAVVAGVSGGADSVALLHLLHLQKKLFLPKKTRIIVAHLNHGLRGEESNEDSKFVESLAKSWSFPFAGDKISLKTGASIESAARKARYDFLGQVAANHGATIVLTAHHADDQAETVLYRILRGSGLRGLTGIQPRSPLPGKHHPGVELVRPLLSVRRDQILEHLNTYELRFREDSTNALPIAARNRIRNEVLPWLERKVHPGAAAALVRLSSRAKKANDALDTWAKTALPLVIPTGCPDLDQLSGPLRLNAAEYRTLPEAIRYRVAELILTPDLLALPEHEFHRFDQVLQGNRRSDVLLGRLRVSAPNKDHALITRLSKQDLPPKYVTELVCPGETNVPWANLVIRCTGPTTTEEGSQKHFSTSNPGKETVDTRNLPSDLVVRTRRVGDRFHPLGAPGGRRLSRFLIDEKIPSDQRDSLPLVASGSNVIWVPGMRICDSIRVTSKTRRVMRLEVLEEK